MGTGTPVAATEGDEQDLVQLTIYGVASLYERFSEKLLHHSSARRANGCRRRCRRRDRWSSPKPNPSPDPLERAGAVRPSVANVEKQGLTSPRSPISEQENTANVKKPRLDL